MIITRTPFRISFAGGGTDINTYYKLDFGAVLNVTINKYMYITVNKRLDESIRLSYSKTETVEQVDDLQHDIVRECLKLVGISSGIEITSVADIPAGTGLGSSSSFTVGLLNALYTHIGQSQSAYELAEKACHIEIDILGAPIGKQDQFAAAFGGLNYYRFNKDESVSHEIINLTERETNSLNNKLMLFYTGISRNANQILSDQKKSESINKANLDYMRDQAEFLKKEIFAHGITEKIGQMLHEGWLRKKELSGSISNEFIDSCYNEALEAGVSGGKLLGAGGGGFLLFYCDEPYQAKVREALSLYELDFRTTNHGSRVVYIGGE